MIDAPVPNLLILRWESHFLSLNSATHFSGLNIQYLGVKISLRWRQTIPSPDLCLPRYSLMHIEALQQCWAHTLQRLFVKQLTFSRDLDLSPEASPRNFSGGLTPDWR